MEQRVKFRVPEILWRCLTYGKRVDDAYAEYQAVYWRLTNTAAPPMGDKVQASGGHDMYSAISIKAEKLERLRRQYDKAVTTASEIIDRLEDERYQAVLANRYIVGMKPHESAKAMHYSMDWEREIHRNAIEAFKKILGGKGAKNAD